MGKKYVMQLILQKSRDSRLIGIAMVVGSSMATLLFYMKLRVMLWDIRMIIILAALLISGIVLIVKSTEVLRDPYGADELIKNPDLFRQAEDLLTTEIYRDRNMIVSEKVIANAREPLFMTYRDEVFLVYIYSVEDYGTTRPVCLHLQTARGMIMIGFDNSAPYEIDEMIIRICNFCKYAKVGYTREGLDYLETMRIRWKNDRSREQVEESC